MKKEAIGRATKIEDIVELQKNKKTNLVSALRLLILQIRFAAQKKIQDEVKKQKESKTSTLSDNKINSKNVEEEKVTKHIRKIVTKHNSEKCPRCGTQLLSDKKFKKKICPICGPQAGAVSVSKGTQTSVSPQRQKQ